MKKFLRTFFLLIILGTLIYQYRDILFARFFPLAPCTQSIPYKLGTFDTQFNISKDYFLNALTDAEAIWEKPFGKQLFIYAPTDSSLNVLKINLIYDYRQQATSKLASLGITVKDDRASYEILKAKFTALKAQYNSDMNAYNAKVAALNQKQQTYQTEVNYWNSKGGASQADYDRLQATHLALNTESQELQKTQIQINGIVDEINALAVELNRLVAILNLSVEKYNTINGARGESFEEGVYMSDGSNREIDIYEFSNRAKLVRVLAHELGHALDLEHVDDPKGIMYKLNQGTSLALTSADLDALKIKCQTK